MAFARMATIWIGATAVLAALGFTSSAAYLWTFTSCEGNAECMGSFTTFLLFAFVLLIIGIALVMLGRRLSKSKLGHF